MRLLMTAAMALAVLKICGPGGPCQTFTSQVRPYDCIRVDGIHLTLKDGTKVTSTCSNKGRGDPQ